MILSQASSRTRGSKCSCEECDSVECFTKRYLKQPCSCEMCNNSKTCLYAQKLSVPEPPQVTKADLSTLVGKTESSMEIKPKPIKKHDNAASCCISFEDTGPPTVVEKNSSKSSKKSPKPSKIPISTDKIFCKSYSITKAAKRFKKNLSRSSSHAKTTKDNANILHETIKKEVIYVYDRNNNTQTITTKQSKVSCRNVQANNYTDEESILNSVDTKYSDKDIEFARSTARLAAQIMNMPYSDFKSSLPESKSGVLQQVSKYPIDIFKRIKEAYKACSCKVCECIAGKVITADDICNCKPCRCDDCKHLTVKVLNSNLFPEDNDGCACIRCDRKDCKGLTGNKAKPRICDCEIRESERKFVQNCDCEPCQCIECSLKTNRQKDIVVARVDQTHINMCDCSPCECAECVRSYGISNEHEATTRREMSTGVNRHPQCQCEACVTEACVPDGNESCWCVRHSKVMSKPFQSDTRDYDIRRANLPVCFEPKENNRNNDSLAMYASITNSYPRNLFDYKKKCSCDPCECLVCNHKDKRECLNVLMEESNTKCRENRVQEQLFSIEEKMGEYSIKVNRKKCGCNFCDCENCQTRKTFKDIPKLNKKIGSSGHCNSSPSERLDVKNEIMKNINPFSDCQQFLEDSDFHNQLVSQQYSTLKNKRDPYLEVYRGFNYNDNVSTENYTINHIPIKDREEINLFENFPYNKNRCQRKIPQQYESSRADGVKPDAGMRTYSTKEETDYKEFIRSPSVNSSMSCLKDSGSLSPLSRNKKKSADSSCNSSGHDYPDYLIHFPKTTVQKCIDDVMKSNFMNAECIKINYMNKPPPKLPTSYKNTVKYKPIPNPPSMMQQNIEAPRFTNNNSSLTNLSVVSKHTSISSKSSLHRMSAVIPIVKTSRKEDSQNIANKRNMTDTKKLKIENDSIVLENVENPVNEIEVDKIKRHVTVNPMHDDLERVQNTLTEAREFSKKLAQLLEKYENANETFENVSRKFKITDYSTNVKGPSEIQHSRTNLKIDTDAGSTQCCESQKDIRLKQPIATTDQTSKKLIKEKSQSKINNVLKVKNDMIQKAAIKNEIEKVDKKTICPMDLSNNDVSVSTEPAYIFKTVTDNNSTFKTNNVKDFLNTIAEEKVSDILSDVYKGNSDKEDKELKKNRNYNYMYKRTMTMSKKMNTMQSPENFNLKASVVTEESKKTPQGTEIKRNAVYSSKVDDFTKTVSKDNLKPTLAHNSTKTIDLQGNTDKKQNYAMKSFENEIDYKNEVTNPPSKNYLFETESNVNQTNVDLTLSNLDLKEALQSFKLKPADESDVQTVFRRENKALINLQSEVEQLLEMPLLQPFMDRINDICNSNSKEKTTSNCTNCTKTHVYEKEEVRHHSFSFYNKPYPKNKYNLLKVNYVNIQQVSNDSVLVKWDAPRNIHNVEGYEVLIDGKAVHKIQNPNKCNAVINGLSMRDNKKILLSIRTITNMPNIERMPATTIIYRPQMAV